jgi:hypothetical protein
MAILKADIKRLNGWRAALRGQDSDGPVIGTKITGSALRREFDPADCLIPNQDSRSFGANLMAK